MLSDEVGIRAEPIGTTESQLGERSVHGQQR
jgi:hypothetical protein